MDLSYFPKQEGQLKQSFLPPCLPHSSASESSAAAHVLLMSDWCRHRETDKGKNRLRNTKRFFCFHPHQFSSLIHCAPAQIFMLRQHKDGNNMQQGTKRLK